MHVRPYGLWAKANIKVCNSIRRSKWIDPTWTLPLTSAPELTAIMVSAKFSSERGKTLAECPGSLTLLFQRASQPGLEILTPNSSWSSVSVHPPGTEHDSFPPILVNIGDLMQFWTNGLLKSTVHRVVFPEGESKDRYSIAYFCHPLDHIEIEAVPSDMIRDRRSENMQQRAEKVTAEGYLKKRLADTYGWGKQQAPARD